MPGRDRTPEFQSAIKSITTKPQWINESVQLRSRRQASSSKWSNAITGRAVDPGPPIAQVNPEYIDFMRLSKDCAHGLCRSYAKLEKLTELARKRTLFDDEESSSELNQLVASIKSDIPDLKSKIELLQQKHQKPVTHGKKNIETHSNNVVISLQQKLAKMSTNFKSTLEIRSQSLKQQRARREMFTSGVNVVRTSRLPHALKIQGASDSTDGCRDTSQVFFCEGAAPNMPNTRTPVDMAAPNVFDLPDEVDRYPQQQVQQQELLRYEDTSYLNERANTMQSIESTIVELGTIFNQLATMVQTQDETITRIDVNINDTMGNVEAAHEALLNYFASINSNRWFIIKVFGLLFFFFVLFVVLH